MKKVSLATALLVSLFAGSAFSQSLQQVDVQNKGTVNFSGKVINQTCSIKTGKASQDIILPHVSTSDLTAGKTTGETAFAIYFDNCLGTDISSRGEKIFAAFTSDSSRMDLDTGFLLNKSQNSPASNVQLQLLNADMTPIILGSNTDITTNKGVNLTVGEISQTDFTATVPYIVRYIAPYQDAYPGNVQASIQYNIGYR